MSRCRAVSAALSAGAAGVIRMSEDERTDDFVDPLTVGELRPIKELAEEFPLTYHSLRTYAKTGRLRAKKFGNQWSTTRAAIEEYLASRDLNTIPKKHRKGP